MDKINPNHYKGDIECIDAIKASMTKEAFIGYLKGNMMKYIWRYEKKNGVEDLQKAEWYLTRLIKENVTIDNGTKKDSKTAETYSDSPRWNVIFENF